MTHHPHVVPADIARGMFPQHHPDSYHPAYDFSPPSITWLVGPIDCAECEGHGEITYPEWEGEFERCQDCDGLGYPPTVEIISLRKVSEISTNYKVHGVVRLDKPVPISGCSWSKEHICTHGNLVIYHAALERPYSEQADTERIITDQIGPCSPGDVAYPIEATS